MKHFILSTILCLGLSFSLAQPAGTPTKTISDDGSGTGTVTWSKDTTYLLSGFVFVNDGQTLTIEAGTVIKGLPGEAENASALIVARGGKIMAMGTAAAPIIFTGESDDVTNPFDLAENTTGLWGGVIILGKAGLNSDPGETAIEGIPTSEPRGLYGGTDDTDNSGVFKYVSIRHGGTNIGANNEINGLTLGGVGSGTEIHHVEVIYNADDGVEFFGGTVNTKYLSVAFCDDDSYDYDEGYRGKGQFWFTIQSDGATSDKAGEHDGGTSPETAMPFATPTIYNATYIGRGAGTSVIFRDNAGGVYANSIFTEYSHGFNVEILGNGSEDSYTRFTEGDLAFNNNLFWNVDGNVANEVFAVDPQKFGGVPLADSTATVDAADLVVKAGFASGANSVADPSFKLAVSPNSYTPGGEALLPVPVGASPAKSGLAALPANDPFFTAVSYKGAFSGTDADFWLRGWTYMDELGYFPAATADPESIVNITDDGSGTGTVTWSKDNTYILNGFVFVNDGQTLTIEAGTVIKGAPGEAENASALIVARGGKIMAMGTAAEPIIFTAQEDDVTNPFDLAPNTTGLWGGVIILGKAGLNSNPGESAIEGIPTSETRGLYGGTEDDDNSGVFKYVSIRHGGTNIGANNEINGLTLGGVGSGTEVHHVEVIFNADDGVEFFGGTVNTKYLSVAFCDDDSYDYDEGYRGKGQFWFTIQSEAATSDKAGEHDGGTDPETAMPFATPTIYNATYIGRGAGTSVIFRDNAGGTYANSIITEYSHGFNVEILGNGSEDSYTRFTEGDLAFSNNLFWNVDGNVANDVFAVDPQKFSGVPLADSTATVDAADADVKAGFGEGSNSVGNPSFKLAISPNSYEAGGESLLPVPSGASPAKLNLAALPDGDPFFTPVSFKGAFSGTDADFWLRGWTYMDELGYFPAATPDPENVVVVTDDGSGTGTVTWSKDNTYILNGFVFVNDGQTLTIEAGTVIKGAPGEAENASALIVARGGTIMAMGTAEEPIIFTGQEDDVTNPFDLAPNTTGLWGGVIILGKASLNSNPGESAIEGIPTSETRGLYGGTEDDDNSGVFKYVSIRHGGTNIGANNEINGLTLGGVGSGTEIHHVEVIFNADDGVEFFGGTVNTSYLAVAFVDDDSYDYDEGFRGKGQFWFTIQSDAATSDKAGEHDGGTDPETAMPFATPVVYNATYIGRGSGTSVIFRDNAGGTYTNSIFTEYSHGINVEILGNGSESSFDRFEEGSLALNNNIFWNVDGNTAEDVFAVDPQKFTGVPAGDSTATVDAANTAVKASFAANNNAVADVVFKLPVTANSYEAGGEALLPVPDAASPAKTRLADIPENDDFFQRVSYKGAFSPTDADMWIRDWTYMDQLGYFPAPTPDDQSIVVVSDDGSGTGNVTWSKDNIYKLDGFVFVNDGQTLTIEAGTVIKGLPGEAENASALIVARGGKILALGTAEEPIIFTGDEDDVDNPFDLANNTTGLWGGVIILGKAGLNSDPGESAIEGIPTSETRGLYGGDVDDDNSGIFKYVSIRHGGTNIGANNEINGLTLGGVGSGTEIHHVEVIYNADDGVEFFGGTVNTSYMAVAFVDDDSYDYDEGFRGNGQFWFTIQSEAATSDKAGEHDGGTDPETAMPFATPTVYNATYIGRGSGTSVIFRDNAGGVYNNSIFTEYSHGFNVELLGNGSESSYTRFQEGDLSFSNNIFWNVDGNVADDVFAIDPQKFSGVPAADSTTAVDAADADVKASFAANNNTVADPLFKVPVSTNTYEVGGESLYPVPGDGSPAGSDLADLPDNDFFVDVPFKGAFSGAESGFWLRGWTYMDQLAFFPVGGVTSVDGQIGKEQSFRLYPNPATARFAIELDQLGTEAVQVAILNPMGQTVYAEEVKPVSGSLKGVFDIQNLSPAVYILKVTQAGKLIGTKRVIKQ